MGEIVPFTRSRSGQAPDRAVPPALALPFLLWRQALCLWGSLWLAPLGLRLVVDEPGEESRRPHRTPFVRR